MRLRGKSIRRKIVALLLVPLVSLAALWVFATVLTFQEARHVRVHSSVMGKIGFPTEAVVRAIQHERRQVMVYLADPRRSDTLTTLHRRQQATDEAVQQVRTRAADDVDGVLPGGHVDELRAVLRALDDLEKVRDQVDENTLTRNDAFHAYNALIDPSYRFLSDLHVLEHAELDTQGGALVGVARAREALSRQDALMAGALAAGHMTDPELRAFADRVAERKLLYSSHLPSLPDQDRRALEEYWKGTDARGLRRAEEAIITAGSAAAVGETNPERWETATGTVLDELGRLYHEASARYHDRVDPAAFQTLLKVGVAGVLGAAALVVSLVISFWVGRGLIRDLSALRKEAHESSAVRLPSVMRRLAAGDQVDVEAEAPPRSYGDDELGQVGQALNTLQRSAVEAAVKQSELRKGVSEVFVNLARRNQVLLHRQLTLLDTMERRTEDSDELADLFRLDHLTTRMRRHAEGLVILSGAAPSRQWRKPVQLMDVVRAAVSEVEDYERVEVRRLPRLAVDGPAVGDLTHLTAELIENATVFSPPHTAVQVVGERVANGFTLEIHDRGLGLNPDALLEANLRLAETPEFELSDTDRLGLFVVSRLAQRQGVRVSLQPSPYGGTTAVVLIPGGILTETGPGEPPKAEVESAGSTLGARARRPASLAGGDAATPALPERPADGPVERLAPPDPPEEEPRKRERAGGAAPLPRRSPRPVRQPDEDALAEQHQQTPDGADTHAGREPAHPGGLAPLPRRTPVLVTDHGRRFGPARPASGAAAGEEPEPETADTGERAGPSRREPDRATTPNGLPRRVRQASLAPQLKSDQSAPGDPPAGAGPRQPSGGGPSPSEGEDAKATVPDDRPLRPAPAEPWFDRDAEEVRTRMAALQRGWQRGREEYERQRSDGSPSGPRPTSGQQPDTGTEEQAAPRNDT